MSSVAEVVGKPINSARVGGRERSESRKGDGSRGR